MPLLASLPQAVEDTFHADMRVEEEAENANLNYTTFEVVSGSGFYPGMLVREIKYSSGLKNE